MKPQYRLLLVSLALILFFVFFCFIYLENTPVQLVVLGVVLLLSAWTFKLKGLLKKLYHFLPFILLLFGVYVIFALFQIGHNNDYWIHYGITRTTLLISSLMFIQVLITWLNIDSFLDFSLGIEKLKYIILGKTLYKIAFSSYSELCLLVDFIPSEQCRKITVKRKFYKRLIVLLALITYVLNEATLKGEMIDERILHCHQVLKNEPE